MTSIADLRASVGLGTPTFVQKEMTWSGVDVPSATIAGGYTPTKSARKAHMSNARAIGISGGAGAGKSLFSGMEAVTWIPFAKLIWILGAKYSHTRAEFEYLSEAGQSIGWLERIRQPEDKDKACSAYSIEYEAEGVKRRCQIETLTLHEYEKQAATKRPDVMILCEPGLIDDLKEMEPTLWGRLGERRGRLIAAGTSEESSEDWYEIFKAWAVKGNPMGGETFLLPTWENLRVYPQGKDDPEFLSYEKAFGTDLLNMRYGGLPMPPKGLVLKGHWGDHLFYEDLEYRRDLPLEIFIDPNYMDPARYVIGFIQQDQMTGDVFVLDEIARSGHTHPEMIRLFQEHPLSRFVMGAVIDPHAGDHHPLGSESPMSYWEDILPEVRNNGGKQIPVRTTVQSLKIMMTTRANGTARLHISEKCERGKWEGGHWKLTSQGKPKDSACDFLKALGYYSVELLENERMQGDMLGDNSIIEPVDFNFNSRGRRITQQTPDEKLYWKEIDKIYKRPNYA